MTLEKSVLKVRVSDLETISSNFVHQQKEYSLNLRFNKSKVEKKELVCVLQSIIKGLQGDSDS